MTPLFSSRPVQRAADLLAGVACPRARERSSALSRIRLADQLSGSPLWHAMPSPEETASGRALPYRAHRGRDGRE